MENYVPPLPARLRRLMPLIDLLLLAAQESAKAAREVYQERTRQRRGSTLRPGPQTPLWNDLAVAAREQLTRYGDKAHLARILGVPRQRVDQYLRAKSACPDAAFLSVCAFRTLVLLVLASANAEYLPLNSSIARGDLPLPSCEQVCAQ